MPLIAIVQNFQAFSACLVLWQKYYHFYLPTLCRHWHHSGIILTTECNHHGRPVAHYNIYFLLLGGPTAHMPTTPPPSWFKTLWHIIGYIIILGLIPLPHLLSIIQIIVFTYVVWIINNKTCSDLGSFAMFSYLVTSLWGSSYLLEALCISRSFLC